MNPQSDPTRDEPARSSPDSEPHAKRAWNPERPGYHGGENEWSSQGELAGLGNFGPSYAPGWLHPNDQDAKTMDSNWRDPFHGGFGNSGTPSESAFTPAPPQPAPDAPEEEREDLKAHPASWAERAYGPRGFAGGFAGRNYDWTRRGERR